MELVSPAIRRQRLWRIKLGLRLTVAERRLLLIFMDLLLINGALIAAVTLWSGFPLSIPVVWAHIKWFATLSSLWFGFGLVLDIYNLARAASTTTILASAGTTTLLTWFTYLSIPWLTPPISTRSYAFGFLLLSMGAVLSWRVFYARALNQPAFRERAIILGASESARALIPALYQASRADNANPFRGTGYQIVGLVTAESTPQGLDDNQIPILGEVQKLVQLARQHDANEIIVALDGAQKLPPHVYEALLDCREVGLRVRTLEDIYERLTARLPVEYARRDLQILLGPLDGPSTRLYFAVKRFMDLVIALAALPTLALVAAIVAVCNAIWSPGPLFYRQQRVGQGGKPFVLIKFRSMVPSAEQDTGPVWSGEDDDRVTPVGRWLRKTRLDELPQIWNVLRGEMSIVGPRPERPHFVGRLARELPIYRARHAVKPGITGWAQIRYRYGNSVEDSRIKLEYDLYYVKHASLYLDILIMLQTLPVMLQLKGQ
ncbi:MAG: sugar transferase [Chloroflexi bacterium]|nr:sugar transferase [Chloroflexota bacterium]